MHFESSLRTLKTIWQPISTETPVEWAQRNINLGRGSMEAFTLHDKPYWIEPINTVADKSLEMVVCIASVQLGKTTNFNLVPWAYLTDKDVGNCIWFFPSMPMAKKFKPQLDSILYGCNALATKVVKDNAAMINFVDSTCYIAGTGTEAQVKSTPAPYVFWEEPSEMKDTDEAGSYVQLGKLRMTTFKGKRQGRMCATVKLDSDALYKEYERGDKRHYDMPCPHCGHLQHFECRTLIPGTDGEERNEVYRTHLVWDEKAKMPDGTWDLEMVRETAHMLCQHEGCRKPIYHWQKQEMMEKGKWIPYARANPGYRSYRINAFYSPFITWGDCAVEFLSLKKEGKLQTWDQNYSVVPTRMGGGSRPAIDEVRKRLGHVYKHGMYPKYSRTGQELDQKKRDNYLIVDKQSNRYPFLVVAHYENGESYIVDGGQVRDLKGDVSIESLERKWKVRWTLIDSQYQTGDVYDWCYEGDSWRVAIQKLDTHEANKGSACQMIWNFAFRNGKTDLKRRSSSKDTIMKFTYSNAYWMPIMFDARQGKRNYSIAGDPDGLCPAPILEEIFDEYYDVNKQEYRCRTNNNHSGDLLKYDLAFESFIRAESRHSWDTNINAHDASDITIPNGIDLTGDISRI